MNPVALILSADLDANINDVITKAIIVGVYITVILLLFKYWYRYSLPNFADDTPSLS